MQSQRKAVRELLDLKMDGQELVFRLSFMSHDGHFEAFDGAQKSLIMDGTQVEKTLLYIRGVTVFLCFKPEICNPSFGMKQKITISVLPLGLLVRDKGGEDWLGVSHDVPEKTIAIRFVSPMLA
jgi:hypothetical protein